MDNALPSAESSWNEIEEYRLRYGCLPPRTEADLAFIIKKTNPGGNDACPCASGKKFKKCCIDKRMIGR